MAVKLPSAEKTEAQNPDITDFDKHINVLGPGEAVRTNIASK
jgi:hypothetical protein